MISGQKYRMMNLARDLNLKSKQLADMLPDKDSGHTHMGTVSPDEFGYLIDKLTSENQIDSIDDYLGGKITIKVPEKTAASKTGGKSASKADKKDKDESKTDSKDTAKAASETSVVTSGGKAAETEGKNNARTGLKNDLNVDSKVDSKVDSEVHSKAGGKTDTKKSAQNISKDKPTRSNDSGTGTVSISQEKTASKPVHRSERMNQLHEAPRPNLSQQKPKQKQPNTAQKQKQHQQVIQPSPRPKDEQMTTVISEKSPSGAKKTRIVDTRTSTVDLSKYDEKLDRIAADAANGKKKTVSNTADGKKFKKPQGRGRDNWRGNNRERLAQERQRKQEMIERSKKTPLQITIPDEISVRELASRLKVTATEVIKRLMAAGVMANVTQTLDFDTALYIAEDLGAKATKEVVVTIEEKLFDETEDKDENLAERAPVVVVMGHVDHGKTSLLDKIRHSNVTADEAGGITQHIGAYRVNINGKDITFLDTPGHAAFTAMRARGAKATDIAILVVAADDGIMPQTVEAINHAKDAGLEIIVAINKMDKHGANPDAVLQELTKYELIPESWGGDVMCIPVSAHTGMGIDELLESILLIAEVKEYKANPDRHAKGIIIESKLDKGRGPVATVLVQNGTLFAGDVVIAGTAVGRVRAMTDDKGKSVKKAGPSVPVEIFGLDEVPTAGDEFNAVENERMARELAEQRKAKQKEAAFKTNSSVSLDDLFAQISDGVKELKIIVKADVDGSAEAVKASLEKLTNEEVKVKVIHSAVGGITEGDVMFAAASNAIIIGFNVRPDKNAIDASERQKVDVRTYRIIYECIEEVEAAMKGMLAPTFKESLLGHAEVRQAIHVPNVGTIAGCYIQDGKIVRSAQIRVVRDGIVIFEDKISSLRRFKDDVREVAQGYECGIGLEHFNDIRENDVLEAFEMVEVKK